QYDVIVGEVTEAMLVRWRELARTDRTVDVYYEMRRAVVDFSFRLIFGRSLGSELDRLTDTAFFAEHMFAQQIPSWIPNAQNRRFHREGKEMKLLFEQTIGEIKNHPDKTDCIVRYLLENPDKELGRAWTTQEMRDESFSVFFGAHALANPLTWTFYLLS